VATRPGWRSRATRSRRPPPAPGTCPHPDDPGLRGHQLGAAIRDHPMPQQIHSRDPAGAARGSSRPTCCRMLLAGSAGCSGVPLMALRWSAGAGEARGADEFPSSGLHPPITSRVRQRSRHAPTEAREMVSCIQYRRRANDRDNRHLADGLRGRARFPVTPITARPVPRPRHPTRWPAW
jgi:hypothetical protein